MAGNCVKVRTHSKELQRQLRKNGYRHRNLEKTAKLELQQSEFAHMKENFVFGLSPYNKRTIPSYERSWNKQEYDSIFTLKCDIFISNFINFFVYVADADSVIIQIFPTPFS